MLVNLCMFNSNAAMKHGKIFNVTLRISQKYVVQVCTVSKSRNRQCGGSLSTTYCIPIFGLTPISNKIGK